MEWSIGKIRRDISSQRANLPVLQAEYERDFAAYQRLEEVMRTRPDSVKMFRVPMRPPGRGHAQVFQPVPRPEPGRLDKRRRGLSGAHPVPGLTPVTAC